MQVPRLTLKGIVPEGFLYRNALLLRWSPMGDKPQYLINVLWLLTSPLVGTAMATYDDQNIFGKILRGEIPFYKVYENRRTLAFLDIIPRSPGHTLIIPKARHAASLISRRIATPAIFVRDERLTRSNVRGCDRLQPNVADHHARRFPQMAPAPFSPAGAVLFGCSGR